MEVIAPIMKDVSPQAHRWWPLVEKDAKQYYEKWRQSTPVERLYVRPRCKVVEEDPSLQRTRAARYLFADQGDRRGSQGDDCIGEDDDIYWHHLH